MNKILGKLLDNKNSRWVDFFIIILFFIIPFFLYWRDISKDLMMVTGDGLNIFVPTFFQAREILRGDIPFWNSYVITGVPFFADPNNSFFYPFHALALIFPPALYSNLYYIIHIGLAGMFTYLFLKKSSDDDRFTASMGAFVVILSTFIGGFRREHVAVYTSIVWLPLILYFILSFIKTGRKRYLLFSALAMTIQFFGGHPQYTFYSDFIAFLYFVYNLFAVRYPLRDAILSLFIWIASYILFSAIFLIPVAELVMQSSRFESNYFTLYSTRWEILLMTLFPYVFGNIFSPLGDYGSAEISIDIYLGIIPLIYALYAARYYLKNRLVQFSVFAIVFSWLYSSWSTIPHIGHWLQKIPVFNFFDVQSRILFIYVFFGIFCFAVGVSDIRQPDRLNRLLKHNLLMVVVLVILALLISILRLSPQLDGNPANDYAVYFKIFLYTILTACLNALLIGVLFLIRERKVLFAYGSILIAAVLLITNATDVGRFALMHNEAGLNTMLKTSETKKLVELLGDDPYRILAVYDNPLTGPYGSSSGLRENLSMYNDIRNLKGRTEFENPRLNELLSQYESRDNHNVRTLLAKGDMLSMLSVRFVLIPLGEHAPYRIPTTPESEILSETGPVQIPANGDLFVASYPLAVDSDRYYKVELNVESPGTDIPFFYVDFFGGTNYDFAEQDSAIKIRKGTHSYSTVIYTGESPIRASDTSFRIISRSNESLKISNVKVVKLATPVVSPDYFPVAKTDNYTIYENTWAQKLLYIPAKVVYINNVGKLREDPQNYPRMDRISYVEGVSSHKTSGILDILSVTNNSLTARVTSEEETFVNHSQSYYPGWKAYIDGQAVPIHLVNGVIQGVEIPPGDHIVKFVFAPLSLKFGAIISLLALLTAIGYVIYENWRHKSRTVVDFEGEE